MRAMVLALALLAGLKVWVQDSFYRSATEDAIVAAYRDRAIAACQKEPQKDARGHSQAPSIVTWANPTTVRLVIGDTNISVYPWQLDHELWDLRYRHAYLVLSPGEGQAQFLCTYDIAQATAALHRI